MNACRLCVSVWVMVGLAAGTAGAVTIQTVLVGNSGNVADTRYELPGYGSVAYTYSIGKYEVTAGQYTAFLNAVAAADRYFLYHNHMDAAVDDTGCNIKRSGSSGSYSYSVATDWANRPVNFVNWGDMARFANWLTNGQPTGPQNASTTEDGSYFLNGATSQSALMAVTRKANATWAIPTEDEWYKAAYYDPNKPGGAGYWDYPTRGNTLPSNVLDPGGINNANYWYTGSTIGYPYNRTEVGAFTHSPSGYGTFDQAGNVWESTEGVRYTSQRVVRGGAFNGGRDYLHAMFRSSEIADGHSNWVGFRVVLLPEPSTMAILALGAAGVLLKRRGRGEHR